MSIKAVVGKGAAPESVIVEGLRDSLKAGDTIMIPWYGDKPVSKGLVPVYDYVLEEELPFILVHANGTTPPKYFNVEHGSLLSAANVNTKLIKAVENKGDAILFLWDGDDEKGSEELAKRAYETVPPKVLIQELTNGLAPISFTEDEPPALPKEDDPPAEESKAFTREELDIMPAAALKRLAKDTGNLPDGVVGKGNYIKVILGEELAPHAYPPGAEPETKQAEQPVTVGDSDPTQPTPPGWNVAKGEEALAQLKKSLYNQTPDAAQVILIEAFRDAAYVLGKHIVENVPPGRNRSLAITALEDTVMRSVKAILLDA